MKVCMKNSIIYIENLYHIEITQKNPMRIVKDTNAVSTVVASLMLIMVVAGSAAFLSKMMQDMNYQTSTVAGKSTTAERTSMKINIISGDLAEPAVEPLVKAYNDKQLGVFLQLQKFDAINVNSNMSIGEVGTGTADIGVSDRLPSQDDMAKYPDLLAQKLGYSGIVVIANPLPGNLSKTTLIGYYNGSIPITAYQMSGISGTQQAFMNYLGNPAIGPSVTSVTGGAGMLDAVKNKPNSIGFIEYGYISSQAGLIAGITNESNGQTYVNITYSNITQAVASGDVNNSYYPLELAHPLYFITKGNAPLSDSFIKWARSSEGQDIIDKNGYISYMREYS